MSAGISDWQGTDYRGRTTLTPVSEKNVGTLKMYLAGQDSQYSESHFERVVASAGFSQLAFSGGRPIGCVCCSVEEDAGPMKALASPEPFSALQTIWRQARGREAPPKMALKILLLTVSPEDRRRGIGSTMLRHVIRSSITDSRITRLTLDVHVDNDGAIRLYRSFGFTVVDCKTNPHNKAWVMHLPIGVAQELVHGHPGRNIERKRWSLSSSTSSSPETMEEGENEREGVRRRNALETGDARRSLNDSANRWRIYSTSNWRRN